MLTMESTAISVSILALLSFISIVLGLCMFLVVWRYRSNERRKTKWANLPSEIRTGWLHSERKPLVPGLFSAKIIQPSMKEDDPDQDSSSTESLGKDKTKRETCGEIFFILRYLVEREELMVRLVQMEGFSAGEDIYNADSAYVDVLLKHIGMTPETNSNNPPRLDIALQQVYYFIISQDQLFSYKLVFKVNTFDQSFRRTVSGEVEVNLFEELGKHIFTGNEVILSRQILSSSSDSSDEKEAEVNHYSSPKHENKDEWKRPEQAISPVPSNLSWDLECDIASSSSSELVPCNDLSDGVQWHRLSGDSWIEQTAFQWPHLSDSVVSVPSSFQFNPANDTDNELSNKYTDDVETELCDRPLGRRSISESSIPHYGGLSPPPKNFYHLVPIPFSNRASRRGTSSLSSPYRQKQISSGKACHNGEPFLSFDRKLHGSLCRKRSLSLPSLIDSCSKKQMFHFEDNPVNDTHDVRKHQSPFQ